MKNCAVRSFSCVDGQEKSCIKRDFKDCIPETGFEWLSKRGVSAT